MAETLQFKKGLLSNLNKAQKHAGTIYITTDERAMYVDISDTERIRLGDFIEVATQDALANPKYQPYQSTALYYITDTNKLLKYIGTSGTDANFKIINSTAQIDADISDLRAAVTSYGTAISDLQTVVGAPKDGDVAATGLHLTIEQLQTSTNNQINSLTNTVNTNKTNIEKTLSNEVIRAKAAEKANANNITSLNTAVEDLDNTKAEQSALNQEVQDRQSAINTVNGEITGVKNRVSTLEGHVGSATSGLLKDVADLKSTTSSQGTAISDLRDDHDALAETVSTACTDITNLKTTVGDSNSGLVKDVADLKTAVSGNDEDILALQNRATEIERVNTSQNTSITDLQTAVGNPKKGSTAATGLHLEVEQLKAKDSSIDGEIANLKTADTGLGNRITALENDHVSKTDLQNTNTAVNNLSNDKVDKTVYNAKVSELAQEDSRLAGLIGENATDISALEEALNNTTDGVKVRLNNLETTDQNHTTEIENIKTTYTTLTKHNSDVQALNKSISDQGIIVADHTGKIGTNTSNIAINAGNISTNTTNITNNTTAISNLQLTVGTATNDTKDKNLYEWVEELLDKDEALKQYIDNGFKAADAMTFIGGVADVSTLFSKSGDAVNAGDTYVITENDDDNNYVIGDLLIAMEDGVQGSNNWTHVRSGYVSAHDAKFEYVNATSFELKSPVSGTLGIVTFKAEENSSIDVTVSHDNDVNKPIVTIGMSWGSF